MLILSSFLLSSFIIHLCILPLFPFPVSRLCPPSVSYFIFSPPHCSAFFPFLFPPLLHSLGQLLPPIFFSFFLSLVPSRSSFYHKLSFLFFFFRVRRFYLPGFFSPFRFSFSFLFLLFCSSIFIASCSTRI